MDTITLGQIAVVISLLSLLGGLGAFIVVSHNKLADKINSSRETLTDKIVSTTSDLSTRVTVLETNMMNLTVCARELKKGG